MQLIVHCGDGKTGSTTVQAALLKSRRALRSQGILYPAEDGGAHACLSYLVGRRHRVPEADHAGLLKQAHRQVARLKKEVQKYGPDFVLLSSEYFFPFQVSDIRGLLRELAVEFETIHVLVYLRTPLSDYVARIQQIIKGSWAFPNPTSYRRDLASSCRAWAAVVGEDNISVRIYDRPRLAGRDIVTDFYDYLELVTQRTLGDRPKVAARNESLAAEQMVLLQDYRRDFKYDKNGVIDAETRSVIRFLENVRRLQAVSLTTPTLKPSVKRAIWENVKDVAFEIDAFRDDTEYSTLCLAEVPNVAPTSPQRFDDVRRILEKVDEHSCNLMKQCIPEYNPIMHKELENDLLQKSSMYANSLLFRVLARFFRDESCNAAALSAMKWTKKCRRDASGQ